MEIAAVRGEDPQVVVEAEPLRRREQVVASEGQIERREHRPERQAQQADDPGREEEEGGAVLPGIEPDGLADGGGLPGGRRLRDVASDRLCSWGFFR